MLVEMVVRGFIIDPSSMPQARLSVRLVEGFSMSFSRSLDPEKLNFFYINILNVICAKYFYLNIYQLVYMSGKHKP